MIKKNRRYYPGIHFAFFLFSRAYRRTDKLLFGQGIMGGMGCPCKKYPNDEELQTLHALRLGLCVKIEQGSNNL